MAVFNEHYQWHPKFFVAPYRDTHYRLLAECDTHLIEIEQMDALHSILTQGKSLTEISSLCSSKIIVSLRTLLPVLVQAGFILPRQSLAQVSHYYVPQYTLPPKINNNSRWKEIVWLSKPDLPFDFESVSLPDSILEQTSLVIVDDYLDPRLSAINQAYRDNQVQWLIIKVTGERAFVGPLFNPLVESACWQCLQHRMLIHSALRWFTDSQDNASIEPSVQALAPIPIHYDTHRMQQFKSQAERVIPELMSDHHLNTLYEINDTTMTIHPVIKRPQCQSCGDPHLFKHNTKPIKLSPSKKLTHHDGGYRTVPVSETHDKLQKLVSPISGLLTHCHTESSSEKGVNQIYRSGFFQVPRRPLSFDSKTPLPVFWYSSMGKGITPMQSKVSALSEGIERLASQYQGDEPTHLATPPKNSDKYILPQQLSPFSDAQYQHFSSKSNAQHNLYSIQPYDGDTPLHWSPVWSLVTHKQCFVPTSFCYDHCPFEDQKYSRFYHNGGAAGNTLEEALLQGFLEIIERDAIAIWWYNQVPRNSVCLKGINNELSLQLSNTLEQHCDYWVLNITTDFNVPVFAAVAHNKITEQFSLGFGCHIDPTIAIHRALTELCQIFEIRHNHTAPFDFDEITNKDFLFPLQYSAESTNEIRRPYNSDICDDIQHLLDCAKSLTLDVLVLNYTRPDMCLHTVKVIIPGTCHLFPYFASERLYSVPVSMQLQAKRKLESQLNQHALLI
ncbi:TOMM precursor leader peptide-binding protein [Pseudoalteromonas sp. MMG005]|uniref:TOMM precursor leader peptide-binding protein n=1 Tax=Pseudoalteromonas sp. MMG005 TaxID=2822682 RepID=UPI001B3A7424|nr:TOMM precursor leader peptide-binding protein [Pseudoalteromonas sp. MMG005]